MLAALDLGNGKLGELGLSYFDRSGGGYAVGTRRTLSEDDADPQNTRDCHDAFLTLKSIVRERQLNLPFEIENVCSSLEMKQSQKQLGGRT